MRIFLLAILQLLLLSAYAQERTISGKITDAKTSEALPGVNIQLKGTASRGTTTNNEGEFKLNINSNEVTLIISFIGMETKEVAVGTRSVIDIQLQPKLDQLNEVVVTALGIEREKQSLAASITKLDSKQLTEVPMTNLVNSLAGQVAGVQITNGSSGVGSSSRIIIRGENSLGGTNQPLFVVDGVPISNEQITSDLVNNGSFQEVDYGNGGADIDPENIASISILKGAGSAALYGSRAANGVVLITTKRGKRQPGLGVTTSSLLTFETLLTSPDYQNEYGAGGNEQFSFVDGAGGGLNDGGAGIASFGPRLDQGTLIQQFDSPSTDIFGNPVRAGDVLARTRADGTLTNITATPWISRPDNVRNFFETGITSQHNVAVNSTGDNGSIRLAYSNFRNEGVTPNTDLNRDGLAISLDQQLTSKLSVNSYINYINVRSRNRPNLGYGYENVNYGFNWTPRQVDIARLKDYWQEGQVGRQHFDYNYVWITNPYLTLFENTNSFNKNRVLGNISANYSLNQNLQISLRTGLDTYNDNRAFRRALSTNRNPLGGYREDVVTFYEQNTDVLLTYKNSFNSDFKYSVSAGANRFDQRTSYKYTAASGLILPNIYSFANSNDVIGDNQTFEKRINSVYGTGTLDYRSAIYLDISLRNDWSSTLPLEQNSFAYYSAGLSYVLSNSLDLPDNISFFKVRLSAASAGNDTDPYQLRNTFLFNQNYGSSLKVTNQSSLKNANLKPERLNSYEAGTEISFFNNRLNADFTVYQNTSVDQIISRPISATTGFSAKLENGGQVQTRGIEVLIGGAILKTTDFTWSASVNFSSFRSKVVELPEGVDQFVTGTADVFGGSGGSNSVFYIAKEGGRVGDMYGSGFVEVDGRTLYDANGLPVLDPTLRLLGNYNPDFSLGLTNSFSYKNVSASVLFDWRQGGVFVSRTKALGHTSGVLKETLVGRQEGIVGDGLVNVGTAETPQYVENTTNIPASTYYNRFFARGNEASALYDASYLKLRQLSLYYNLNKAICERIGFQNVKIGFVGSNLLLFTENPHVDPELNASQGTNIVYGVDDMSYPSTRSFGFSIKTQF